MATDVCVALPAGTGAMPKSIPPSLKPVDAHGPLISIAAFPAPKSVSPSTPFMPIGEMPWSRMRPLHFSTASTLAGSPNTECVLSSETMPPPFAHRRTAQVLGASRSGIAMPY